MDAKEDDFELSDYIDTYTVYFARTADGIVPLPEKRLEKILTIISGSITTLMDDEKDTLIIKEYNRQHSSYQKVPVLIRDDTMSISSIKDESEEAIILKEVKKGREDEERKIKAMVKARPGAYRISKC